MAATIDYDNLTDDDILRWITGDFFGDNFVANRIIEIFTSAYILIEVREEDIDLLD